MAIALYRKYRPRTFAEVVSQEHVKTTLLNAVSAGQIGHAYIFVGARGIGKTTLARLFAKAVNCQDKSGPEPCGKCEACQAISEGKALDLIEIDAASNRGIEEIRELREKVKFTPSRLKYKVFIIDEVHMLTKEAFNALLKTLEEPPEHAIFLLATTEPHKVLATIMSRCQRFDLKKLTVPELVGYLKKIAKSEGIEISQEALELIAQQSDGCARDAVSLFTQLGAYAQGKIEQALVKDVLGVTDQAAVADFVGNIIAADKAKGIDQLRELVEGGYDLEQFTKNLVDYLRKILLVNAGADVNDVILADLSSEQLDKLQEQAGQISLGRAMRLIKLFLNAQGELGQSVYPQLPLELAFIEAVDQNGVTAAKTDNSPSAQAPLPVKKAKLKERVAKPARKVVKAAQKIVKSTQSEQSASLEKVSSKWGEVIEEVMPVNHSLATFLRMGELKGVEGEHVMVAFKFRFHKEQVSEHKYRKIVEEVMEKVYDQKLLLRCQVDDSLEAAPDTPAKEPVANVKEAPEDVAEMAKSVFGGKLV